MTAAKAVFYTVSMPAKTKFNHHPKSATEVLSMLLGRTEDAWGTLEEGLETSGVAEGGANPDLEKGTRGLVPRPEGRRRRGQTAPPAARLE